MASSLVAKVRRRSRAEGRAQGEVVAARSLCEAFVKQHHPAILALVAPVIAACEDPGRLRDWALAAPRVSDDELVRRVGTGAPAERPKAPASGSTRARTPRPSRHARPRR
jgi:hypothetical protein